MSLRNGWVVTGLAGAVVVAGCGGKKSADEAAAGTPGVTATEIKIGQTMPYSGPASAYAAIGKADVAYLKMINDKGGINGRKITLISLDDAYAAPKTVELTRKLVEDDGVAFIFNSLGTAANTAIQRYLNDKKIPQLFVATGADKWADPAKYPWTMGWQPSYRTEAKIYARYLLKETPGAKVCVLFQNDDFGKDYLAGLKDGFGDQYDKLVVKTESYEVTDPTVDSQIVALQAAGCDTEITAATPKAAAGAIRKMFDIGWKPRHLLTNVSVSITTVLRPAGIEKSTGIITAAYLKDPSDPAMASDPGLAEYRAFMKQYLPDLDPSDVSTVYAYGVTMTLVKVLTQCGNDLSRANIMKQAANLSHLSLPVATPGIEVNTGAGDFKPFSQMKLAKFNGTSFETFGDVISAD
ncbi:MAG TPA: ABC transporter substrate-binding protein [Kofleriaceae bacterium]|jgi:branched-chain amino acid transport system substrate-binding protein|nr:ABC transporter substrate-binding protein [Kofleriaceae bacterium]